MTLGDVVFVVQYPYFSPDQAVRGPSLVVKKGALHDDGVHYLVSSNGDFANTDMAYEVLPLLTLFLKLPG